MIALICLVYLEELNCKKFMTGSLNIKKKCNQNY